MLGSYSLDKSKIRAAYEYLHKLFRYETVGDKKLPVPVFMEGMFGGGKTEAALLVAWLIDTKHTVDKLLILAFPLRDLRDDKYYRLMEMGARPFLLKAHDEVCQDLRACVEEVKREKGGKITRRDYFKCLQQHLQSGNCNYKQHIEELKNYVRRGGRVIVTTHLMSRVAKLIFQDAKLIIDEAEDYLLKLSEPIPKYELDVITDEKIRRMIRRYFDVVSDSVGREYYVINPSGLVSLFARDAVYISATIPPAFKEYFHRLAADIHRLAKRKKRKGGKKKKVPPPTDFEPVRIYAKPDRDIVLILNERLYWKRREEWYPDIFSELIKIAKVSVEKYGVLGVVSKNKEMTRDLVNLFKGAGFSVWADIDYDPHRSRNVFTRADVVILTVRGPLYRGRSVFSVKRFEICKTECNEKCEDKKNEKDERERKKCFKECYESCQKDFPVIVGFYQARRDKIHPVIQNILIDIGGEDLYRDFRNELLQARNLQAIYRFNRERDKEHIMILLDERFAEAYETYYERRFRKEMRVLWIYDRTKIFDIFSSVVPK